MHNPTRRSDPVYDIKHELGNGLQAPLHPAPSSPGPAPVGKPSGMIQDLAETGSVAAIFAARRDCATQRSTALYGADISGTLDECETAFVGEVMRLAVGAHPFAAIRMLTMAIVGLERDAHEPQDIEPRVEAVLKRWGYEPLEVMTAADQRLPWVEPTVTEFTGHPVSAKITISGVDLPNPAAPAPTAADILKAIDWLRQRAMLQPTRSSEFEIVARIILGASAETQRQAAEISELQDLLEEAAPIARFVAELATMTDIECEFVDGYYFREKARSADPAAMVVPRLYGEEDRERAIDILDDLGVFTSLNVTALAVDKVAEALGLRRAS